jgi:molecular chaperone GrpE
MTKEPTDHHKKQHKHNAGIREEEKLFDFNKSFQDDPETPDPENQYGEVISALESSVAELKEKNLRLLAEFENYKKRTMRERLDLMNSASKDVIKALLPVLDDFDRAKKHAEESSDEQFSEGVRLAYNRLYAILQSLGLKAMDSVGESFDPELHEAITEVPAPEEKMSGKILDVIEQGYMLNDKIIRHAKVVVGK